MALSAVRGRGPTRVTRQVAGHFRSRFETISWHIPAPAGCPGLWSAETQGRAGAGGCHKTGGGEFSLSPVIDPIGLEKS